MILIPIVFSVEKSNNQVLLLFGIIPIDQIKFLCDKCNSFLVNFVEEKAINNSLLSESIEESINLN